MSSAMKGDRQGWRVYQRLEGPMPVRLAEAHGSVFGVVFVSVLTIKKFFFYFLAVPFDL